MATNWVSDLYSPRNDPQIDPEMIPTPMIPTFLLVGPEMIPKDLENGNKTWDCGLLFCSLLKCYNSVISSYSYEVSNKRKLFVGSLSRSSLAPVSFQSTCGLLILMCKVSNRSSVFCFTKGRISSTTWRTSTVKKTSWRKFVRSVPRN